jgi:hypothetical protein
LYLFFKLSSSSFKVKVILLGFLLLFTLIHYLIYPPFYKTQKNKIFNEDGVKSKMILLNYLVDMEDLYYESGEDNLK